jgi:hypothetical protein
MILTKPWTSAPRKWSLAAPDDEWTEVFCTHNEEPDEWKHIDKSVKDDYENKYKKGQGWRRKTFVLASVP